VFYILKDNGDIETRFGIDQDPSVPIREFPAWGGNPLHPNSLSFGFFFEIPSPKNLKIPHPENENEKKQGQKGGKNSNAFLEKDQN